MRYRLVVLLVLDELVYGACHRPLRQFPLSGEHPVPGARRRPSAGPLPARPGQLAIAGAGEGGGFSPQTGRPFAASRCAAGSLARGSTTPAHRMRMGAAAVCGCGFSRRNPGDDVGRQAAAGSRSRGVRPGGGERRCSSARAGPGIYEMAGAEAEAEAEGVLTARWEAILQGEQQQDQELEMKKVRARPRPPGTHTAHAPIGVTSAPTPSPLAPQRWFTDAYTFLMPLEHWWCSHEEGTLHGALGRGHGTGPPAMCKCLCASPPTHTNLNKHARTPPHQWCSHGSPHQCCTLPPSHPYPRARPGAMAYGSPPSPRAAARAPGPLAAMAPDSAGTPAPGLHTPAHTRTHAPPPPPPQWCQRWPRPWATCARPRAGRWCWRCTAAWGRRWRAARRAWTHTTASRCACLCTVLIHEFHRSENDKTICLP